MQPVNYTIQYYQGDNFTLIIYPKDSTGQSLDLTGAVPQFRIANIRGEDATDKFLGDSVVDTINGGPLAIIASVNGTVGDGIGNGYVYDIGYTKDGSKVTILTGSFSVIKRVEQP
jgi:hypothetical protein